jgi:hypothetical protein
MKNFYALAVLLMATTLGLAQVSVTFQVDMNNETVSADGVHIAGGFQGWDPTATLMSDDDMDGVYEVTVELPADSTYEFKFINGTTWDDIEDVPPTCQVEVTGNDNRFLALGADDTEVTYHVCYASCAACGMTTVRFRVDMSNEEVISPAGVHVAGNFQGWDVDGTPMVDSDEDGVWEAWASFYPDSLVNNMGEVEPPTFKFINGNSWTNPNENLIGEECADSFGNRILELTSENMVLSGIEGTGGAPCYGSCGTCQTPTQVTFRVDMTTQETVSVNGVHIAGSFQGWDPSSSPLSDDDGDGIWETTFNMQQGDIYFKFVNGNAWGGEGDGNVGNESIVGSCAGDGDNRYLVIGSEDILYEVCYNSCDAGCVENPDPADLTFRVDMTEEEVSAAGVWVIGDFTSPNWQAGAVQMSDDDMDGVYEVTVNVSGGANVQFKFVNGDPSSGGENGVDFIEESGILLDTEGNEVTNFELDGCGVPTPFDAYNRIHERSGEPEILEAVCFNKCTTCVVAVDEIADAQFNAYPNPFNATLTLDLAGQSNNTQLIITDLSGRVALEQVIPAGSQRVVLNTESMAAGSYIVQWLNQGVAQASVFVKH